MWLISGGLAWVVENQRVVPSGPDAPILIKTIGKVALALPQCHGISFNSLGGHMSWEIDWTLAATVLGSLATAASVVFAYYQFKAGSEEKFFSDFRLSLIDLRSDLRDFDFILSEPEFADLGYQIAGSIDEAFSPISDKDEFIAAFADSSNRNVIIQAIYMGHQRANLKPRMLDLTRKIERVPPKYRESFPVSMSAMQDIIGLYTNIGVQTVNPSLYIQNWIDDKARASMAKELTSSPNRKMACLRIGVMFSTMSSAAIVSHGQGVIDLLGRILDILLLSITPRNDATLKRYSAAQKAKKDDLAKIDLPRVTDDIQEKLKLIRDEFSDAQWDELIALNATLAARYDELNKS